MPIGATGGHVFHTGCFMKAKRHRLLKLSDLQSGVETLVYVTDQDATALEEQLAVWQRHFPGYRVENGVLVHSGQPVPLNAQARLAEAERLRPYAWHLPSCPNNDGTSPCNCGFADLVTRPADSADDNGRDDIFEDYDYCDTGRPDSASAGVTDDQLRAALIADADDAEREIAAAFATASADARRCCPMCQQRVDDDEVLGSCMNRDDGKHRRAASTVAAAHSADAPCPLCKPAPGLGPHTNWCPTLTVSEVPK